LEDTKGEGGAVNSDYTGCDCVEDVDSVEHNDFDMDASGLKSRPCAESGSQCQIEASALQVGARGVLEAWTPGDMRSLAGWMIDAPHLMR
jgi:hypothetical protein